MVKTLTSLILLIFGFNLTKADNQRLLSLQAFRNKINDNISNSIDIFSDITTPSNTKLVIPSPTPTLTINTLQESKNNNNADQFQKNSVINLQPLNSTTANTLPSLTKNEIKT